MLRTESTNNNTQKPESKKFTDFFKKLTKNFKPNSTQEPKLNPHVLYKEGLELLKKLSITNNQRTFNKQELQIIDNGLNKLKEAANLRHSNSQYRLGIIHQQGIFVEQNYQKATTYYELAIQNDHPLALNNLAYILERGLNGKKDPEKAMKLYMQAADKNSFIATLNLAKIYENGKIFYNKEAQIYKIEQNLEKCIFYYQAANKINGEKNKKLFIKKKLGIMLIDGVKDNSMPKKILLKQNIEKGIKFLIEVANNKDSEAMLKLGKTYENGVNNISITPYKNEANKENEKPKSTITLLKQDLKEARIWYTKYTEISKDKFILEKLGNWYLNGVGGNIDTNLAIEYYESSIAHGNTNIDLYTTLANIFKDGIFTLEKNVINEKEEKNSIAKVKKYLVKPNEEKALKYYILCAKGGCKTSQLKVGEWYTSNRGLGVHKLTPKDLIEKSINWYNNFYEQNDKIALRLARIYFHGKKNIIVGDTSTTEITTSKNSEQQLNESIHKNNNEQPNKNVKNVELKVKINQEDTDTQKSKYLLEPNIEKSLQYYDKAVELCNASACNDLALIYFDGIKDILEKDLQKSYELFSKGLEINPKDGGAQFNCGFILETLLNTGTIIELSNKNTQNIKIINVQEEILSNNENTPDAKDDIEKKIITKNNNTNNFNKNSEKKSLINSNEEQNLKYKNQFDLMIKWYEKASNNNINEAPITLGNIYSQGKIIEKNKNEAIRWYKEAEKQILAKIKNINSNIYQNENSEQVIQQTLEKKLKKIQWEILKLEKPVKYLFNSLVSTFSSPNDERRQKAPTPNNTPQKEPISPNVTGKNENKR